MRVGIRAKLVILLILVAGLPLVAALAVVLFAGSTSRIATAGDDLRANAVSEALARSDSLSDKYIGEIRQGANDCALLQILRSADKPMPKAEVDRLQSIWHAIPITSQPMAGILNNPISTKLHDLQLADAKINSMIVTDRFGQTVAATARTNNFYQADKDWWRQTYNNGSPRVYVPQINFGPESSNWAIELCVPVMDEGTFLGVIRAEIDMGRWLAELRFASTAYPVKPMFVSQDGWIIWRENETPFKKRVPQWHGPVATGGRGWRITKDGEMQGFAPVSIPETIRQYNVKAPQWEFVLYMPESTVLWPIYRRGIMVAGVVLAIIAVILLLGVWLAERSIVQRIRKLEMATRSVARGDFTHRIDDSWVGRRLLGSDEIDDLAHDFNEMVDRVQSSHDALSAANDLKVDFIRVAGHELRTPVSYMLGMSRLLKDSTDPGKLLYAVQSMGSKAKRLDEIIQAMFKLMPDQMAIGQLNYRDIVLAELLEEVYLDSFPFVEKRSQRLIIENDDPKIAIKADREKLRDIIENLVMNAIKFTPDQGIIHIRVNKQLGGFILIAVQDQGPGIPDAEMRHIFKPFFSGGDVLKHSSGEGFGKRGMGLGLAIVKYFVELHGGTVGVSTGPAGSIFTVSLPEQPPEA
jgi:signal transduction histidine kinase